jgi:hypothetical protein
MSTPNKFSMGGMPRTTTGLVPASYKSKLDSFSGPKEWSPLPKQPKPEMYVYRGDYINARNQKLRAEKAAKKQTSKKSPVRAKPKSDGGLKHVDTNSPAFDTYCQDISITKLSKSEAAARATNKQRFLNYMRAEQSKRATRNALEKKLQAELDDNGGSNSKQEGPAVVKPRKPAVPRLSYFAKTGQRTKSEMAKMLKASSNDSKSKVNEVDGEAVRPKTRSYLEFISKKPEKQVYLTPKQQHEKNSCSDVVKEPDQLQERGKLFEESNEESVVFRAKIEAIVQKAAAMVKAESVKDEIPAREVNSLTLDETVSTTAFSNSQRSIDQSSSETQSKCDTQQSTKESELSLANDRLQQLEERIKCLSLEYSDVELRHDSESIHSEITIQERTPIVNTKCRAGLLEQIDEHSVSYASTNTEIFPRAHIQPTQLPSQRQVKVEDRSTNNANTTFDTFSWSVSLTNESNPTPDRRKLSNVEFCESRLDCHEQSLPDCHQLNLLLEVEQPMPPCIEPSAQPRQAVDWGEEPMPRGFNSQANEFEVANDILSLL